MAVIMPRDILRYPVVRSPATKAWADLNNQLFPILRGCIRIGYAF